MVLKSVKTRTLNSQIACCNCLNILADINVFLLILISCCIVATVNFTIPCCRQEDEKMGDLRLMCC